jgi:uncharacterized membrane protein
MAAMDFDDLMRAAVQVFEVVGVSIFLGGAVFAFGRAGRLLLRREGGAFEVVREDLGRAILLGLEILIVADIIETITIAPTIESAVTLGIIVLVRTFLSFSLEIELEGVLPWRRSSSHAGGAADAK